MSNRRQHFVSQHYLRQFRIGDTPTIWVTKVDPLKVIGAGGIKGQCQDDYFYGRDSKLDQMPQDIEHHVAPVLVKVLEQRTWNEEELAANHSCDRTSDTRVEPFLMDLHRPGDNRVDES